MLKKLLVAIDGTEYSWRALEYAIGIAKMAESELVVLTVAREGLQHTPQLPLEGELAGDVNGPAMQVGNEVLGAAKHIIDEQNIPCSYVLVILRRKSLSSAARKNAIPSSLARAVSVLLKACLKTASAI